MSMVSRMFLRPNIDGYYGQQSQILRGLWTPYGLLSPMFLGVWPDGSVVITYHMNKKASFTKEQKQKIKYVKDRGVEVRIVHPEENSND